MRKQLFRAFFILERLMSLSLGFFIVGLVSLQAQEAGTLSPHAIMQKVEERPHGASSQSSFLMKIQQGKRDQLRYLQSYTKKFYGASGTGDDADYEGRMLIVTGPATLKDTAYLIHDYKDLGGSSAKQNDRIWNYLPSIQQTKRIPLAEQSQSFLGSDFTYADFNQTNWDNYALSFVKEDYKIKAGPNDGREVWVISALPNQAEKLRTGYDKIIMYIEKASYMILQAVYDLSAKRGRKYMQVLELQEIQNILTAVRSSMSTVYPNKEKRSTLMSLSDIRYDVALSLQFQPAELGR